MSSTTPSGTHEIGGIVHRPSPLPVAETTERLVDLIAAPGAKLFALVDHSGEAEAAGLSLRETKLLIFGSPAGGTPVMQAAPSSALDLPLKILVWSDDAGAVWMSYLAPDWLATRHGILPDLAKPLRTVEVLTGRVADTANA